MELLALALVIIPAYYLWHAKWGVPLGNRMLAFVFVAIFANGIIKSFHVGNVDALFSATAGIMLAGPFAYFIGFFLQKARVNRGEDKPSTSRSEKSVGMESNKHDDAVFYGRAAREVYSGDVNVDLMAKAFSIAGGNEEAAKAKYIEIRAQQLKAL